MPTPTVFDPQAVPEGLLAPLRARRAAFAELATNASSHGDGAVLSVRLEGGEVVALPPALARIMAAALAEVADGHAVEVRAVREDLSTQQAADLLGVSRPFLVGLLGEGAIPSWKVGTHRRARRDDVLAYRATMRSAAKAALQNLADQAQDLGLGYGSERSA